jgi:hypothetical protein
VQESIFAGDSSGCLLTVVLQDYQGYVLSLVNHRVTIGNLEVMRTAYRLLRLVTAGNPELDLA